MEHTLCLLFTRHTRSSRSYTPAPRSMHGRLKLKRGKSPNTREHHALCSPVWQTCKDRARATSATAALGWLTHLWCRSPGHIRTRPGPAGTAQQSGPPQLSPPQHPRSCTRADRSRQSQPVGGTAQANKGRICRASQDGKGRGRIAGPLGQGRGRIPSFYIPYFYIPYFSRGRGSIAGPYGAGP